MVFRTLATPIEEVCRFGYTYWNWYLKIDHDRILSHRLDSA